MIIKKTAVVAILLLIFSGCSEEKTKQSTVDAIKTPGTNIAMSSDAETKTQEETLSDQADKIIQSYVEMNVFSGSVLVEQNGDILINKGYGMADAESQTPNTTETTYFIGSLTKQFTAAAIMQLAERGLLDLNDPITEYLPKYERWSSVTIENLLTHSSGIVDYLSIEDIRISPERFSESEKVLDKVYTIATEFVPGSKFAYSNTGYYILGCIVEKVSNASYGSYLEENIFKPLNMTHSGYKTDLSAIKNCATPYEFRLTEMKYGDLKMAFSAGGIFSTNSDMYLWDRGLYTEEIISKQSIEQIFSPHIPIADGVSYGYGWGIKEDSAGRRVADHSGTIDGFTSHIRRYLDDDTVIIVMSNIMTAPKEKIADELSALLFD